MIQRCAQCRCDMGRKTRTNSKIREDLAGCVVSQIAALHFAKQHCALADCEIMVGEKFG